MTSEPRWKLRFNSFSRAYALLRNALDSGVEPLNELGASEYCLNGDPWASTILWCLTAHFDVLNRSGDTRRLRLGEPPAPQVWPVQNTGIRKKPRPCLAWKHPRDVAAPVSSTSGPQPTPGITLASPKRRGPPPGHRGRRPQSKPASAETSRGTAPVGMTLTDDHPARVVAPHDAGLIRKRLQALPNL